MINKMVRFRQNLTNFKYKLDLFRHLTYYKIKLYHSGEHM
jgi:hypothetical protein